MDEARVHNNDGRLYCGAMSKEYGVSTGVFIPENDAWRLENALCTCDSTHLDVSIHRLTVELDFQRFFWAPCAQLYSLAESPQLPLSPHIRGRYWSAKIDDISL
jgi:hypothetical protein